VLAYGVDISPQGIEVVRRLEVLLG